MTEIEKQVRVMLRLPESVERELSHSAKRQFRSRNAEAVARIAAYNTTHDAVNASTTDEENTLLRCFRAMSASKRAGLLALLSDREE